MIIICSAKFLFDLLKALIPSIHSVSGQFFTDEILNFLVSLDLSKLY